MILRALAVFLSVAVYDVCWARYVTATSSRRRWAAAAWSSAVFAAGSFAICQYTSEPILVGPAVLGAYVGTLIGVKE